MKLVLGILILFATASCRTTNSHANTLSGTPITIDWENVCTHPFVVEKGWVGMDPNSIRRISSGLAGQQEEGIKSIGNVILCRDGGQAQIGYMPGGSSTFRFLGVTQASEVGATPVSGPLFRFVTDKGAVTLDVAQHYSGEATITLKVSDFRTATEKLKMVYHQQ
jgi:hypothetical protein